MGDAKPDLWLWCNKMVINRIRKSRHENAKATSDKLNVSQKI